MSSSPSEAPTWRISPTVTGAGSAPAFSTSASVCASANHSSNDLAPARPMVMRALPPPIFSLMRGADCT